jgi:hypothetical protein
MKEKTDNVIETFETCMHGKKDIQCNAINSPQKLAEKERTGILK